MQNRMDSLTLKLSNMQHNNNQQINDNDNDNDDVIECKLKETVFNMYLVNNQYDKYNITYNNM